MPEVQQLRAGAVGAAPVPPGEAAGLRWAQPVSLGRDPRAAPAFPLGTLHCPYGNIHPLLSGSLKSFPPRGVKCQEPLSSCPCSIKSLGSQLPPPSLEKTAFPTARRCPVLENVCDRTAAIGDFDVFLQREKTVPFTHH